MQWGTLPPARRPTPTWPAPCSPELRGDGGSRHIILGSVKHPFNLLPTETSCKRATQRKALGESSAATRAHACAAAFSTARGVSSRGTSESTEGGPHTSITGAMTPKHRLFHGHHAMRALCSPDSLRTRGHRQDGVARAPLNARRRPCQAGSQKPWWRRSQRWRWVIKSQKRYRTVTRKKHNSW